VRDRAPAGIGALSRSEAPDCGQGEASFVRVGPAACKKKLCRFTLLSPGGRDIVRVSERKACS